MGQGSSRPLFPFPEDENQPSTNPDGAGSGQRPPPSTTTASSPSSSQSGPIRSEPRQTRPSPLARSSTRTNPARASRDADAQVMNVDTPMPTAPPNPPNTASGATPNSSESTEENMSALVVARLATLLQSILRDGAANLPWLQDRETRLQDQERRRRIIDILGRRGQAPSPINTRPLTFSHNATAEPVEREEAGSGGEEGETNAEGVHAPPEAISSFINIAADAIFSTLEGGETAASARRESPVIPGDPLVSRALGRLLLSLDAVALAAGPDTTPRRFIRAFRLDEPIPERSTVEVAESASTDGQDGSVADDNQEVHSEMEATTDLQTDMHVHVGVEVDGGAHDSEEDDNENHPDEEGEHHHHHHQEDDADRMEEDAVEETEGEAQDEDHPMDDGPMPRPQGGAGEVPVVVISATPMITPSPAPSGGAPATTRRITWMVCIVSTSLLPTHPILLHPERYHELHVGEDATYEDLLRLGSLLGSAIPATASPEELEESGLEIRRVGSPGWDEGWIKGEMCSVCLEEWGEGAEVRILRCQHGFHQGCVDKWLLEGANKCPNCRVEGVDRHRDEVKAPLPDTL